MLREESSARSLKFFFPLFVMILYLMGYEKWTAWKQVCGVGDDFETNA